MVGQRQAATLCSDSVIGRTAMAGTLAACAALLAGGNSAAIVDNRRGRSAGSGSWVGPNKRVDGDARRDHYEARVVAPDTRRKDFVEELVHQRTGAATDLASMAGPSRLDVGPGRPVVHMGLAQSGRCAAAVPRTGVRGRRRENCVAGHMSLG